MLSKKIRFLANKIKNKSLRIKVIGLLEDPAFETNGRKYPFLALDVSPAGLAHHHNYVGGYVEHVVSSANLALALCSSVEKIYSGKVNHDLVLAGVLVHDVFKPSMYALNENGSYTSTRLADYIDHLSVATSELVRRDFPLELIHIVASHHGEYGPIRPRTVEALICNLADMMDSRLNGEVLDAARYLARKATGAELRKLTAKEAFEIVHSKAAKGWKGVSQAVERIGTKDKARKP